MKKLVFFLILLSVGQAFGQNTTSDSKPFIEVIGTAEMEVIPNEIYIGIVIRERYVNKDKVSIEEQEEKLKAAINSLGINLENLTLSDANADYMKIRWQKKDVLTKKDYTLKVSNATTVGLVFQELEKLEILDAFISKVSHSKMDSLNKEVRIMAVKAAKAKAEYLLVAIGEQIDKPLIVSESPQTIFGQEFLARTNANITGLNASSKSSGFSDKTTEIQFNKIKLSSKIYVKYSIKEK